MASRSSSIDSLDGPIYLADPNEDEARLIQKAKRLFPKLAGRSQDLQERLRKLPNRFIAGVAAAIVLLLCIYGLFSPSATAKQDLAEAKKLISSKWAGLDATYAAEELTAQDIRPNRGGIQQEKLQWKDDFRQIKVASNPPAMEAMYEGRTCLVHYPGQSVCMHVTTYSSLRLQANSVPYHNSVQHLYPTLKA